MADGDHGSAWVCKTCGLQYPRSLIPPRICKTCEDERQYLGPEGQEWTTIEGLVKEGYHNDIKDIEKGLIGFGTEPSFGIGQRAILAKTPEGNILWDCITVITDKAIQKIKDEGGIEAVAISHPHFYGAMVEWARTFDCPVYLHEWDKQWIAREDDRIRLWSGNRQPLFGGATLFRLGGHFPGSSILVLEQPQAGDKPIALTGDTIQVTRRDGYVSYMYSYPIYIPLPASEVQKIRKRLESLPEFEKIYGGWWTTKVEENGKQAAINGADRYLKALDGFYTKKFPDYDQPA